MSLFNRSFGQKTMSVYGGAGGHGTRISSSQKSYVTPGLNLADGLDLHVGANEKTTMQNLNDRLAAYLKKVHTLEKKNESLEKQITEWYQSRTVVSFDHSAYFATIEDLREKIRVASNLNSKTILDTDTAKLTADDFKVKYENEMGMKLTVETDIARLKQLLDELNLSKMDLEGNYEFLRSELIVLQKNHEEELALLRAHMGGQVNVDVDASPSLDLNEVITKIRQHYEGVIANNSKEIDLWYQNKITAAEQEVHTQTENLVTKQKEVQERKNILQKLEIDVQSSLSMKASLDGTLRETQERYATKLANLQNIVTSMEAQLSRIHKNITYNKQEYDMLLDLKNRLEMEIAEYMRLLDGEDESLKKVVTKVITVVETVVGGKVVESSKTVENE